jgi:hypothetical protein
MISAGVLALALGCGGDDGGPAGDTDPTGAASTGGPTAPGDDDGAMSTSGPPISTGDSTSGLPGTGSSDDATGPDPDGGESSSTGEDDPGPMVDVTDPQLHEFEFTAQDADAETSTHHMSTQLAHLDTNATPLGRLVVYLHGAGTPTTCGSRAHGEVLAAMGFHVVHPCYVSDYGVGNCGDDIGGCRLEAFEGVDHHPFIAIAPPDSIETRVVRALQYLQTMHPGGDWQYYLDGETPRWEKIVISGISHGASTAGVIGMNRSVDRVVSLSGPLDTDQAWLLGDPITPIDRFWAFTHTGDEQHPGHLQSFDDMMLPGEPVVVDGMAPPYGGSHRLVSSAPTGDGHGSTQAGGSSPQDGDAWVFDPVWRLMYVADE